jgi:hypothetical protein
MQAALVLNALVCLVQSVALWRLGLRLRKAHRDNLRLVARIDRMCVAWTSYRATKPLLERERVRAVA